jgi:hypothetical protein
MPEHPTETGSRPHGGCETRSVVDHAVLGEELNDLVVKPVIDTVRIPMDEIDDVVLVQQPTKAGGIVSVHQCS